MFTIIALKKKNQECNAYLFLLTFWLGTQNLNMIYDFLMNFSKGNLEVILFVGFYLAIN